MPDIHERLAMLEANQRHLDKCMDETKQAVKDLQITIWKASGVIGLLVFLAPLLLK